MFGSADLYEKEMSMGYVPDNVTKRLIIADMLRGSMGPAVAPVPTPIMVPTPENKCRGCGHTSKALECRYCGIVK